MSLFDKAKKFFKKPEAKQKEKIGKLEKLIERLVLKAENIQKRIDKTEDDVKRERLIREYKALKKILRKSRRHIETLRGECEK